MHKKKHTVLAPRHAPVCVCVDVQPCRETYENGEAGDMGPYVGE
jgi:hypothetical protein